MSGRGARGLTLIEVLVALALGGLVVLLAHRTFLMAGELGSRVAERREAHDRAMNARRFLAHAFGSLDIAGRIGFQGRAGEVTFATWLLGTAGLPELCVVTIRMEGQPDSGPEGRVVALVSPLARADSYAPDTLVLVPRASGLAFDYLLEYGADAQWVAEWRSPVSAPLAARLRVARADSAAADTLLFAIGPRG